MDDKKSALQVGAFNFGLEDYGAYLVFALPNNNTPLTELINDIDPEIEKLQTDLISEEDYQKLMNQFENNFVDANTRMLGVAENLADGYAFYGNTGHINDELKEYRKITREQIREVAKKYLGKDQRLTIYYLPESAKKPKAF